MKKIFYLAVYSLLFPFSISATPLTDARDLALGGMTISDIPPEVAVFGNPSVLSTSQAFKTSFSQTRLTANDFEYSIATCFPVAKGQIALGVGWDSMVSQNQQLTGIVRDSNGQVVVDPVTGMPLTQVLGFFTRNINSAYLSAGFKFGKFSIGVNLKGLLADFGNLEGYGVGMDIGARIDLASGVFWGGSFYDVGDTSIDFHGGTQNETMPMSWASSLSLKVIDDNGFSIFLEPAVSQPSFGYEGLRWQAALEASWMKDIFLRVGDNQDRPSFGIGLIVHPSKIISELKIDYAYLGGDENDYPSRLTLSIGW
jgi:hypothetical protein